MHSCVFMLPGVPPTKFFSHHPERLANVAERAEVAWVNCITADVRTGAERLAPEFGFNVNLVRELLQGRYSSFVDNETQAGLMLPTIQIRKGVVTAYPVLVLLREGLIVTIQDRHITRFSSFARYAETHLRKIPADWSQIDKMSTILMRLIDENNRHNYRGIKDLGEVIDNLGKLLADHGLGFAKISKSTYELKHSVTVFQTTLWENYETLRAIQHGDAHLISSRSENLEHIDGLIEENSWYIQLGENLTLILGSGSEAMQDYHAIHLLRFNNIVSFTSTWLSVLGTMFLIPNTIATGMANTAYTFGPGDAWWYTAMLVTVTLASCGFVYWGVNHFWKITMSSALDRARASALAAKRTGINRRSIQPIAVKPGNGGV
jgi:magnesium transporter